MAMLHDHYYDDDDDDDDDDDADDAIYPTCIIYLPIYPHPFHRHTSHVSSSHTAHSHPPHQWRVASGERWMHRDKWQVPSGKCQCTMTDSNGKLQTAWLARVL